MKKLIIALKSRNDIFSFSRLLQQNGVFNTTINTPNSIGSTCSLSIRCDAQHLEKVKHLIYQIRPNSFYGLFLLNFTQQGEQILKLVIFPLRKEHIT